MSTQIVLTCPRCNWDGFIIVKESMRQCADCKAVWTQDMLIPVEESKSYFKMVLAVLGVVTAVYVIVILSAALVCVP